VSNRVDIYDQLPEGKSVSTTNPFGVTISKTYGYPKSGSLVAWGPQAQRGADVHLWVGGTWVETDPATGAGKYVGGQERPDLIQWTRTQGAA
jgi:hypothetical protein